MTLPKSSEILIVGSGIMGAAVARLLREKLPTVSIVMIDGGSPIGDTPGLHLHDVPDPELWGQYNAKIASGIQGMYTGAEVVREVADDVQDLSPGMFHALALGEEASDMPATALSWNAGGMGVHWTAATPWPSGDETFAYGDPEQWNADLETARRVLRVSPAVLGPTAPGQIVLDVLNRELEGTGPQERMPQPMPMAVEPTPLGALPRTGPSRIFAPIAGAEDPHFTLLTQTLATAIIVDHASGRALGARVRHMVDGGESEVLADTVIVCADTVRTPQLLFASGIRPAALGRYLNEHAFITGRVLMDLERFGLDRGELPTARDGEFCTDSLWMPQNGDAQPFHGQIMNVTYTDESGSPLAYSVGMSFYTPVESRPENRLAFSESELDLFGMPQITFDFTYSANDLDYIERAQAQMAALCEQFGTFDPVTESAVLAPGSSLHLTGTVRMGESDDGTSVCDTEGKVWGWNNLFVAGNGVIPTPIVANATLTGTITAVRAARAVVNLYASHTR